MSKKTSEELLARHKAEFEAAYEESLDDAMGKLFNHFTAFISEARIPLYNALVVLELVKAEVVEQIRKGKGLI